MIQNQEKNKLQKDENPVRKLVSQVRMDKKLTYNTLASKINASATDVENFENGAYLPSDIEKSILKFLDIPETRYLCERQNLARNTTISRCEYKILGLIARYHSIPLFLFRMNSRYFASLLIKAGYVSLDIDNFYAKLELTDAGVEKYFELSQYYSNGKDFKVGFFSKMWFGSLSFIANKIENFDLMFDVFDTGIGYTEALSFLILAISLIASVTTGNHKYVQICSFLSGFALCAKGLSILKQA